MKLRIIGAAIAVLGLSASAFMAPAQAAAPPIDDTWSTLTATCVTKTVYGGLVSGSTGTGGGAAGVGWTSVGKVKTCLQVKSTKIRAIGYFIPYSGWTWDEGYFTAYLSKCGGATVSGSSYITPTYGTTTTYTFPFAGLSVTRGASYSAAAYVSTNSRIRSAGGDIYTFSSISNYPAHTTVQQVKSTCGS